MSDEDLLLGSVDDLGDAADSSIALSQKEINDLLEDKSDSTASGSDGNIEKIENNMEKDGIENDGMEKDDTDKDGMENDSMEQNGMENDGMDKDGMEQIADNEQKPENDNEIIVEENNDNLDPNSNNLDDINKEPTIKKRSISALAGCSRNENAPLQLPDPPAKRRKMPIYLRERTLARQVVVGRSASITRRFPNQMLPSIMKVLSRMEKNSNRREIENMKWEIENLKRSIAINEVPALITKANMWKARYEKLCEDIQTVKKECMQLASRRPAPQPLAIAPLPPPQHVVLSCTQKNHSPSPISTARSNIYNANSIATGSLPKRASDVNMEFRFSSNVSHSPMAQMQPVAAVREQVSGRLSGHLISYPMPPFGQPYSVYDVSMSSREIICMIPEIPGHMINCDAKIAPAKPNCFPKDQYENVTVRIKSTSQDFHDNWQIAGTIEYEGTNCRNKTVQLFIQITSFRLNGLAGKVDFIRSDIDWGCSKSHQCIESGKMKFRVKFHKDQRFVNKDRFFAFAAVVDRSNNRVSSSTVNVFDFEMAKYQA